MTTCLWYVDYLPINGLYSLTTYQSKRRKTLKDAPSDSDHAPPIRKTLKDAPSDSDDAPLIRKTKVMIKKPPKITAAQIGESDDSDTPLRAKLAKKKQEIEKDAE